MSIFMRQFTFSRPQAKAGRNSLRSLSHVDPPQIYKDKEDKKFCTHIQACMKTFT